MLLELPQTTLEPQMTPKPLAVLEPQQTLLPQITAEPLTSVLFVPQTTELPQMTDEPHTTRLARRMNRDGSMALGHM